MRNIRRKLAAMITAVSVLALTGCNGIGTKEEEKLTIEVSADKVTVEAGQDDTIEIEDYDDLEKVKIEVEDEDIAEAEADDETITVTGIAEGKTTLTISAKDCEDIQITIKVTEAESSLPNTPETDPDADNGNGGTAVRPVSAVTENDITGDYYAEFPLTPDLLATAIGQTEDESELEMIRDAFSTLDIEMKFKMSLYEDHSAEMTVLYSHFKSDFRDWLDVHYLDFMGVILAGVGEDMTPEMEEQLLAMKDQMMDNFMQGMDQNMAEDDVTELHWECDGDILTLNGENKTRECEIDSDGSFTISFTEEEMGEDAAIFAPEGGSFDLVFHR